MLPARRTGESFVSPLDGLLRLRHEVDRLFDRVVGDAGMTADDRSWSFPVDSVETEDVFRYEFEVPGFSREDLDVTVENGVLTVSGERRMPAVEVEREDRSRRWTERRYGRFTRSFRLPGNAVVDELTATCQNGLLVVRVPKSAEARPRRIEVRTGDDRRRIGDTAA